MINSIFVYSLNSQMTVSIFISNTIISYQL
jgi:hypothetical protein